MPKVRTDRKQIYAVVSRKDLDTLQTAHPEEPTSSLVRKAVERWAETVRKAKRANVGER